MKLATELKDENGLKIIIDEACDLSRRIWEIEDTQIEPLKTRLWLLKQKLMREISAMKWFWKKIFWSSTGHATLIVTTRKSIDYERYMLEKLWVVMSEADREEYTIAKKTESLRITI